MKNLGRVFILGDSYSTFEGWIPEGYNCFYLHENDEERGFNDVTRVEMTWWHQLIEKTGSTLVRNCSFSGGTICNTGYDGADFTDRSFVGRFDRLVESGFFCENPVDTLIMLGGTNDDWAGAPLGADKFEGWTGEDLYQVRPAYCYLLNRIRTVLPGTRIISILNTGFSDGFGDILAGIGDHYGIDTIRLHDIDKIGGHPGSKGMDAIYRQVLESC